MIPKTLWQYKTQNRGFTGGDDRVLGPFEGWGRPGAHPEGAFASLGSGACASGARSGGDALRVGGHALRAGDGPLGPMHEPTAEVCVSSGTGLAPVKVAPGRKRPQNQAQTECSAFSVVRSTRIQKPSLKTHCVGHCGHVQRWER